MFLYTAGRWDMGIGEHLARMNYGSIKDSLIINYALRGQYIKGGGWF